MRKSIFDLVTEKLDMKGDTNRLITMASEEKILCTNGKNYYTLYEFVDTFCFKEWKQRSHYIDLYDFLKALDYRVLIYKATYDIDAHLTLIELIYNIWQLAHNKLNDNGFMCGFKLNGNFYHIKNVMDEILEECNHTVYSNEDKDYFIVVENKSEITATAEIMPTNNLSFDVIKYNHSSLKGDIEAKKTILFVLGAELEPKRKNLQEINRELSDNVFFMLNNLNVRHNNCVEGDPKNYKEYVAQMSFEKLEEWYDELYQMMLLAFLILENIDRSKKVSDLKRNVTGGK